MKIAIFLFVLLVSFNYSSEECPLNASIESFDKKICNDQTSTLTGGKVCCWYKVTTSSLISYSCLQLLNTKEALDIFKEAQKLAKVDYDLQCSAGLIIPSFIVALALLVL